MGSILTVVLVGLAFGAVQLVAGLLIGRGLARHGRGVPPHEVEQLQQYARQLHRLTASVAEDVEGHQLEIGEANEELDSAQRNEQGLTQTVIATVQHVMHINRRLQQRLHLAEGKLQQQSQQIESSLLAAHTDALTGLLNRRAFDANLDRLAAQWQRKRTPFCLLVLDIDFFKQINDRYGHAAGDAVLRTLGETLDQTIELPAKAARAGGEEFAVLLPGGGAREARRAIDRIYAAIASAPFGFGRMKLSVTVSMGLAIAAADDTAASIFHRADEALYASKHAGRNCAHYHNGRSCEPILLGGSNDLDLITVEPNDGSAARAALPEELVTLCEELRNRLAEVSRNPSTLVRTAAED